ncbi:MAG: hypothetical protein ACOX5R_18530 [bacterium]|jgi:cell division protein FtsB
MSSGKDYDYASEEIRNALVEEYLRLHPDVKEQDVMLACIDGKLVFTHVAAVLSDLRVRKKFSQCLMQGKRLFSELAIHHDKRWRECMDSTRHSKQVVDCLHSTHFNFFNDDQWNEQHMFLKRVEKNCARRTVILHEAKDKLGKIRLEEAKKRSPKARVAVIEYLNTIVEQLKSVQKAYEYELNIGDTFSDLSQKFIRKRLSMIKKREIPFSLKDFSELYKTLKGDKKATLSSILDGHENILLKTKNALTRALEDMKENLEERRAQFQEIWEVISSLEQMVESLEEVNQTETEPPAPQKPKENPETPVSTVNRMARFVSKISRNRLSVTGDGRVVYHKK